MNKIFLLIISLFLTLYGSSQTERGQVHLKNGSVLKGRIHHLEGEEKIRLETAGNIWMFRTEEIDSIVSRKSRSAELNSNMSNSKIFYRLELGVLAGNSDNNNSAPFSANASMNYSIKPAFSVGVGVGIDFFNESYLPATINLEYKLKNKANTPYIFCRAGYEVPLESSHAVYYDVYTPWSSFRPWPWYESEELDANGGFIINPGIGYQLMVNRNFGLSFTAGYQFHRLNYQGEGEYELDIDYNRLTLKVGIIFN